jgi:hypothetical protein
MAQHEHGDPTQNPHLIRAARVRAAAAEYGLICEEKTEQVPRTTYETYYPTMALRWGVAGLEQCFLDKNGDPVWRLVPNSEEFQAQIDALKQASPNPLAPPVKEQAPHAPIDVDRVMEQLRQMPQNGDLPTLAVIDTACKEDAIAPRAERATCLHPKGVDHCTLPHCNCSAKREAAK